ncbi:hypothetical protein [Chryseolinea lacunae]|uniref:Uncharacterized protein n=1 Tax=Chryseolinea lacunae TaxID=2801331 RepID=A0ABS1KRS1_9BACT|nr:hypothetical protein [Chryseolinea lacunae]MBL0741367.1 hypothetical protein [Chryseolinea lacunae]
MPTPETTLGPIQKRRFQPEFALSVFCSQRKNESSNDISSVQCALKQWQSVHTPWLAVQKLLRCVHLLWCGMHEPLHRVVSGKIFINELLAVRHALVLRVFLKWRGLHERKAGRKLVVRFVFSRVQGLHARVQRVRVGERGGDGK